MQVAPALRAEVDVAVLRRVPITTLLHLLRLLFQVVLLLIRLPLLRLASEVATAAPIFAAVLADLVHPQCWRTLKLPFTLVTREREVVDGY